MTEENMLMTAKSYITIEGTELAVDVMGAGEDATYALSQVLDELELAAFHQKWLGEDGKLTKLRRKLNKLDKGKILSGIDDCQEHQLFRIYEGDILKQYGWVQKRFHRARYGGEVCKNPNSVLSELL